MPKVGEEGSLPWADGDLNVQAEMTCSSFNQLHTIARKVCASCKLPFWLTFHILTRFADIFDIRVSTT